jgi:hypothetical protein
MYFAVSSGQVVDEKIRIANAADAAAYSAATVEARALNYSAYATRAIIANQVSLAQALSIASWTNYFADLWVNLDHASERLGDLIPPNDLIRWGQLQAVLVGEAYATAYGGVDPREIAEYVNYGAAAAITASDLASQGLELSETLVRQAVRQHPLAAEVARTTDAAIRVSIVPATHGFDSFIKRYGGNDRGRLADVVRRSRDDFSKQRQWTLRNLLGFLGSKRMERTGGTDLQDFDHWAAVDDVTYRDNGGLFSSSTEDTVARGWATVGSSPQSGSSSTHYLMPALFSGLPSVYDISDSNKGQQTTGLSVFAFKPRAAMLTAGAAAKVQPSGRLAVFDGRSPGNVVAALSRAEIFFERPDERADRRTEGGSLFDPYWRVRLVAPVPADRLYAAFQQDGVVSP